VYLSQAGIPNPWWSWNYITTNSSTILSATREHVILTVVAVGIGLGIALPVALLVRRSPWARGLALGLAGVMYAIPSLALFIALIPFTGLTPTTVEIGLVMYTLLILLRNILAGLDGVPADVRETARAMGYGPLRLLATVELPLSLPAVIAGLRIATVSTIALVTIGATVDSTLGGLGGQILQGLQNNYRAQAMTAAIGCVLLAAVADGVLLLVQRLTTPWSRR
jgi:osmoprotectant transport system permease protein